MMLFPVLAQDIDPGPPSTPIMGNRIAIAAYQWDGSLDTSFGNKGKLTVFVPGASDNAKVGAALDSHGRIVAAISVKNAVTILRFTRDGDLDKTFNKTGKVVFSLPDWPTSHDNKIQGHAVAVDEYDRILLGAVQTGIPTGGTATSRTGIFYRFLPDGTRDSFEGVTWSTPEDLAVPFEIRAFLASPDRYFAPHKVALSPDGFDTVFTQWATSGFSIMNGWIDLLNEDLYSRWYYNLPVIVSSVSEPYAIAKDVHGRVLVAGTEALNGNPTYFVGRWRPATDNYGEPGFVLDRDFGTQGKVKGSFSGAYVDDRATGMQIDAGGNIVIAGRSAATEFRFGVARLRPDGSADPLFGNNGRTTTKIGLYAEANGVVLAGEKIIAGGYANVPLDKVQHSFAVVRYNGDGSLDQTFGTAGRVSTYIGCGGNSQADTVLLQRQLDSVIPARILAVGTSDLPACPDPSLKIGNGIKLP